LTGLQTKALLPLILAAMKMRELEARTSLNRETIRVYFRHGLLPEPSRPQRNVADYDERHVQAILAVRQLQSDNGLTLQQIKDVLKGRHGGRRVEAGAFQNLEALVQTRVGLDNRKIPIVSLLGAFPHAQRDADVLDAIGILDIVKTSAGPALSVTDARLVTIWSEMRMAGYTESSGFSPEILAFYLEPAKFVAGREAALFLERTEGKISSDKAAKMLQDALRLMLDFFGLLRMKEFLKNIHRDAGVTAPGTRPSRRRKANGPPR
jgi:DNA-binding transcriptional MerR regulator